jgi:FAD synthetase
MPTAAVVIIGNEILTGKFADDNGPFAIRRFRELGCELVRLTVVRDDLDEIADEVRRCSACADLVVTSGGVGPTHDDITLEGVARAFGEPLELRHELVALIDRYGLPRDEATLRMARVPVSAHLEVDAALSFPVVQVHNVYVLPGIPRLFQMKLDALAPRFAGPELHTARVFVTEHETAIAGRLTAVAAAHPQVAIGSYPRFGEGPFRVIVTLEARDRALLEAAVLAVRDALVFIDLDELPAEAG